MVEQIPVSEMVVPDVDTIGPNEPVRVARRRMEAQTLRSLIVVEDDRPVGVVQWRDIMRDDQAGPNAPVSEFMVREFPVLQPTMTMVQAREQLGDVDIDRLPVVNADGRLIGEVPRIALSQAGDIAEESRATAPGESPYGWPGREQAVQAPGSPVEIETRGTTKEGTLPSVSSGMNVHAAAGKKLGTVEQVIVDQAGRLMAFTVQHGFLGRKRKRIPTDIMDHVEDDTVVLVIDQTEFNMLPDLEDVE